MKRYLKLGQIEAAVSARLKSWRDERFGQRLWAKDAGLWPGASPESIISRLGWLDLPDKSRAEVSAWMGLADDLAAEGIADAVVLGMGGSSLAPEVFGSAFGRISGYPRLSVLDSVHPEAVRNAEACLSLKRSLFIVSSKSGTTIETVSLLNYFFERLRQAAEEPGRHFIAITDAGTTLDATAREKTFRKVINAPSDVGGRFSALSAFGLVPAAIAGINVRGLLDTSAAAAAACGGNADEEENPGLALGAALGEAWLAGRDKLTLFTSASLAALPWWIEQLVAESTGKCGKGIVPIVGEPLLGADSYGADRFFVHISSKGGEDPDIERLLGELAARGHPAAHIVLDSRNDLGAEMLVWEIATSAACAVLGVNPFDQPDVETSKRLAREAMAGSDGAEGRPSAAALRTDEADAVKGLIADILARAKPGSYIALQAYLPRDQETTQTLEGLRLGLIRRTGLPTTIGYGPRFLHSTGQLHKGGPDKGIFIQILDRPARDLAIPSGTYTFADLIRAQALGDAAALAQLGRPVARIEVGEGPASRHPDIARIAAAPEAS